MRCFIAIDLPREIVREIERIQKELDKKKVFVGKFVELENLHLTLKFLGEIDEEKIEEVKKELKKIKFSSFDLGLGSLGVFSSNFIRIVWVKVLGKGVYELQRLIDSSIEGLGFEKENRFMGHITLARVKSVKDRKLFLKRLNEISVSKKSFSVDRFYLIKSELKPFGPEYEILEEFEFN